MADEMTPEQPNLVQQYVKSVQDRKLEAEAQMQKLMRALDSRRNMPFDPVGLRIAGALFAPTKTGGAGESFGYAATAAADEMQKQALQNAEFAKMEFELSQKQQAQKIAQDEQNFAMQYFNRKRPPVAPAVPAAPAPAAPVEAPAEPADVIGSTAMRGEPPAASVDAIPGEPQRLAQSEAPMQAPIAEPPAAPAAAQAPVRQLEDEDDAYLAIFAPNVLKIKRDLAEEKRKQQQLGLDVRKTEAQERVTIESGGVKFSVPKVDADRITKALKNKDYETAKQLYEDYAIPFPFVKEGKSYRLKTAAESAEDIELAKAIETKPYFIPEVGGTVGMLPKDFRAYRKAVAEGKGDEWVDTNLRRKPAGGESTRAEAKPFQTEEERVAEQKRRERKAEEQAKSEVKTRDDYISSAKVASVIEKPANQIFKIASDPIQSKALGLLENPDVFSAIAGVTADGVRVGPFNVGIPAIRDAVAKVTGDPKEREQILNALQMLGRNYSEIELNFTRLYLKGEGAVTEGERAIVRQVSGGVANRRVVALAQTETLLQRAAFDKAVKTELLQWEKANPNKSIDEFTESAGYKKLVNNLDRNTDAIYNKYFGGQKEPKAEPKAASTSTPAAPAGSLRDRIDAAKKARGLQ
jgi:hypothetical protein